MGNNNIASERWYGHNFLILWASLVAQTVKRLPAMQETQVWSLGWEDPLEKEMATHSSTLAWVNSMDWGAPGVTRLSNFTFTFRQLIDLESYFNLKIWRKRIFLFNYLTYFHTRASLVAHTLKHLPAMQETQVWSLDQEGPLEKEMATHSGILAWEIPWTEGPDSHKESDMTEWWILSLSL